MIRIWCLAALLNFSPVQAGGITVSDAFVPLAPKTAMAHAAYMSVTNDGVETQTLISVTAPAYAMAHLHETIEKDGVARMSALPRLELTPGETVTLQPGGMHVMLMKPKMTVGLGDTVELELVFDSGDTVSVSAEVVRLHGSS